MVSSAPSVDSEQEHKQRTGHGPGCKIDTKLAQWIGGDVDISTVAVHGGVTAEPATGAILTPVYMSTAFVQPSVEEYLSLGYSYTRQNNPTVRAYEKRVAALEGGLDAVCTSSGMAATVTVLSALLKSGDHCILTQCSYGGTNRCARVHFSKYNIEFSYVDMKDPKNIESAIKDNTKMIFSETPTNPVMEVADVRTISDIAKKHSNANRRIYHVCDTTFATPFITRGMNLGADVLCISTTKYYDGHNTSVGGAIVVKDSELFELMSLHRNILGNIMTPQVAFLQAQLTKTLHLRIQRQSDTAQKIAEFLEKHPAVESVTYPGLKSYPQKALADKQHAGGLHGGMLCFDVRGGTVGGTKLMDSIKRPWTLCENLGSAESIITCPAVFTHANMLAEDRLKVGITDGLIRISCGLEDVDDLITALKEALDSL